MRASMRLTAVWIAMATTVSCAAQTSPVGMVYVRGGWFDMGVPGGEDNPAHRVFVDDFWMAQYEVTAGQWRAFVGSVGGVERWGKFWFTQQVGKGADFRVPDDWAMFTLTWYEAIWYCNWRSEQEDLEPAYSYDDAEMRELLFGRGKEVVVAWNREANGYRLPTEAEWEYAARGGPQAAAGAYPEGTPLTDIAWYAENSTWEVHPVGQKKPNVLGLYDTLGNVNEWCWDYYGADYYSRSPPRDPAGPDRWYDPKPRDDSGQIRVSRGASWMDSAEYCTEAFRFRPTATNMTVIGIRLVRPAM